LTVVTLPAVVTDHCCCDPFCWKYWANVTGAAVAEPTVITAKTNAARIGPALLENLLVIVNSSLLLVFVETRIRLDRAAGIEQA
jgi:hypothetical protein